MLFDNSEDAASLKSVTVKSKRLWSTKNILNQVILGEQLNRGIVLAHIGTDILFEKMSYAVKLK